MLNFLGHHIGVLRDRVARLIDWRHWTLFNVQGSQVESENL